MKENIREELTSLYKEYHSIIEGNSVLKHDFKALNSCVKKGTNAAHSAEQCEKIIHHLIAEVAETAEDDQRMDDEGPVCENNNPKSCQHLQEHLNLKQDLETYHLTYLADKYRRP